MKILFFSSTVVAPLAICLLLTACGSRPAALSDPAVGIVGGTEVPNKSEIASSTVGILGSLKCTGVIYDEHTILTAAHCAAAAAIIFSNTFAEKDEAQYRDAIAAVVHPNWVRVGNDRDDIALVKFAGTLPAGFKPATWLTDTSELKVDAKVVVAGYGYNEVIFREVFPKDFASPKDLENLIRTGAAVKTVDGKFLMYTKTGSLTLRSGELPIHQLSAKEVVVDQSQGHGTCSGDSGGPGFILKNGQCYLWGIGSRGTPVCYGVGIFANILQYKDWIEKTAKSM